MPQPASTAGEADPQLEHALAQFVRKGRDAHPTVNVPDEELVVYVAKRLPAGAEPSAFDQIPAADLYLACGCARQDPHAIAEFERTFAGDIDAILSRFGAEFGARAALRDEARQRIRERLFVAEPGVSPKIANYSGTGSLLAFLRVVTVRIALDLLRARSRMPHDDASDDELLAAPASDDDPELLYLKLLYRSEFKAAFAEALTNLDEDQRALLRYHFVDRLSIDKIGVVYSVHRATAARRLESARQTIVTQTQDALQSRLNIEPTELKSILRLVASQVDLSVERLLK